MTNQALVILSASCMIQERFRLPVPIDSGTFPPLVVVSSMPLVFVSFLAGSWLSSWDGLSILVSHSALVIASRELFTNYQRFSYVLSMS